MRHNFVIFRRLLLGCVLGLTFFQASYGQSAMANKVGVPVVGSTDQLQVERNSFAYSLQGAPNVHRDSLGKPCIRMSASSTTMVSNATIFTHQLTASNSCQMPIKVSVCYYGSSQCQQVLVPAFARKGIVLGVYPALKDFRYQYTEQF
jgi:hypothetical protein